MQRPPGSACPHSIACKRSPPNAGMPVQLTSVLPSQRGVALAAHMEGFRHASRPLSVPHVPPDQRAQSMAIGSGVPRHVTSTSPSHAPRGCATQKSRPRPAPVQRASASQLVARAPQDRIVRVSASLPSDDVVCAVTAHASKGRPTPHPRSIAQMRAVLEAEYPVCATPGAHALIASTAAIVRNRRTLLTVVVGWTRTCRGSAVPTRRRRLGCTARWCLRCRHTLARGRRS